MPFSFCDKLPGGNIHLSSRRGSESQKEKQEDKEKGNLEESETKTDLLALQSDPLSIPFGLVIFFDYPYST